ncbi:hypothetical protein [Hymenobacter nivis]|uniref:Uncharacterized protein n=1 Tax=Hymenobacter nivis TaxID=1850093 RepID=A0A2Z3GYI4_9BACT|nr:hypothetical protein [Hymenobacter nivis]AWM34454.1 hypothetical protein DDQ68_17685 [Hymenobacter nivis]
MATNPDLESKVIQRFIVKSKQDRYIQFVNSSNNRKKFIANLAHFRDLEASVFELVSGIEEEVVRQALAQQGIATRTCYVISENSQIDARVLDISEAMRETVGHQMGTMLVFGDADALYYESETMKIRYISKPR